MITKITLSRFWSDNYINDTPENNLSVIPANINVVQVFIFSFFLSSKYIADQLLYIKGNRHSLHSLRAIGLMFWYWYAYFMSRYTDNRILWNSIALSSNSFTGLANAIKYMEEGVLYNIAFTELPYKRVFGHVTAFHGIGRCPHQGMDVYDAFSIGIGIIVACAFCCMYRK